MRYPVAIETGTETNAFGVVVPDLPGCFSAGDTLDEALDAAQEAVSAWIDAALDAGAVVPAPSSLDAIRAMPEFAGWVFGIVQIDPAALDDRAERVNITLPRRVLLRLDAQAQAGGETRSGYIARMTMMQRENA
jgi:predicted RNase H-like HicB family nuclease